MKKLLLMAASIICLNMNARAQAGTLIVDNQTPCDVYMILMADVNPGCGFIYRYPTPGTLMTFPPMTMTTYTTGTYTFTCASSCTPLTLSTGDYINGVRIYDRDASFCSGPGAVNLSEPCGAQGTGPVSITFYDSGCSVCGTYNVTWTPAGTPGGTATLTIN